MYLIKTPWWLRALYPSLTWRIKGAEKLIYLTFDDGPHEIATPFVLEQLARYQAKASFFCIGKNVAAHPAIYERILAEGHSVGNHTYHHLNGWKVSNEAYGKDIAAAGKLIKTSLFRPPYGRIRRTQLKQLLAPGSSFRAVIMWDVLSGDFDPHLTPEACLAYVLNHTQAGSVLVFHDSAKAWERLRYVLPKVLEHFTAEGYCFSSISM
ncbi:MAG: polysaccharide deacetylase family protein [Sediminibacterium sp.]